MNIKKILSQKVKIQNGDKTIFEMSYKQSAISTGILAQALIATGAIFILQNPFLGVAKILYGFFIMLPISYYHMREYEKEQQKQ
jgi:hypothetical protein